MPYYKVCSFCGAHLDPGEKCDCQRKNLGDNRKSLIKGDREEEIGAESGKNWDKGKTWI